MSAISKERDAYATAVDVNDCRWLGGCSVFATNLEFDDL